MKYSTRRRPEWALRERLSGDSCACGAHATNYLLTMLEGDDPVPLGVACQTCAEAWVKERNES